MNHTDSIYVKYLVLTILLFFNLTAQIDFSLGDQNTLTSCEVPVYESPESICEQVQAEPDPAKGLQILKDKTSVCGSSNEKINEAVYNLIKNDKDECISQVKAYEEANYSIGQMEDAFSTTPQFNEEPQELSLSAQEVVKCEELASCLKNNIIASSTLSSVSSISQFGSFLSIGVSMAKQVARNIKQFNSALKLPNTSVGCSCAKKQVKNIKETISNNVDNDYKNSLKKLNDFIKKDRLKNKPIAEINSIVQNLYAVGNKIPKSCIDLYKDLSGDRDAAKKLEEQNAYYRPPNCQGRTILRSDFQNNKNDHQRDNIKNDLVKLYYQIETATKLKEKIGSIKESCRAFFNYSLSSFSSLSMENPIPLPSECNSLSKVKSLKSSIKELQLEMKEITKEAALSAFKEPMLRQFLFADFDKISRLQEKIKRKENEKEKDFIFRKIDTLAKNSQYASEIADNHCQKIKSEIKSLKSDLSSNNKNDFVTFKENEGKLSLELDATKSLSKNQLLSSIRRFFNDNNEETDLEGIMLKNLLYTKIAPAYCSLQKASSHIDPRTPNPVFEASHALHEDRINITDEKRLELGIPSAILQYAKRLCRGDKTPSIYSQMSQRAKNCLRDETCSNLNTSGVFTSNFDENSTSSTNAQNVSSLTEVSETQKQALVSQRQQAASNRMTPYNYQPTRQYTTPQEEYNDLTQKLNTREEHIDEISQRIKQIQADPQTSTVSNEIALLEKEIRNLRESNLELERRQAQLKKTIKKETQLDNNSSSLIAPQNKYSSKPRNQVFNQEDRIRSTNNKVNSQNTVPSNRKFTIAENYIDGVRGHGIPVGRPQQLSIQIADNIEIKTPQQLIDNIGLIAQADQNILKDILKAALNSEDIYLNDEIIHFNKDEYPKLVSLISKKLGLIKEKKTSSALTQKEHQLFKNEVHYYKDLMQSTDFIQRVKAEDHNNDYL